MDINQEFSSFLKTKGKEEDPINQPRDKETSFDKEMLINNNFSKEYDRIQNEGVSGDSIVKYSQSVLKAEEEYNNPESMKMPEREEGFWDNVFKKTAIFDNYLVKGFSMGNIDPAELMDIDFHMTDNEKALSKTAVLTGELGAFYLGERILGGVAAGIPALVKFGTNYKRMSNIVKSMTSGGIIGFASKPEGEEEDTLKGRAENALISSAMFALYGLAIDKGAKALSYVVRGTAKKLGYKPRAAKDVLRVISGKESIKNNETKSLIQDVSTEITGKAPVSPKGSIIKKTTTEVQDSVKNIVAKTEGRAAAKTTQEVVESTIANKVKNMAPAPAAGGVPYDVKVPEQITGMNMKKIWNQYLDMASQGAEEYEKKKFLAETVKTFEKSIQNVRGSKVTLKEMEETAKKLEDVGWINAKKWLSRATPDPKLGPAEMVLKGNIIASSVDDLMTFRNDLFKKGPTQITQEDLGNLALKIQETMALYSEFAADRASAARTLNSMKIIRKGVEEKNFKKIFDILGNNELNEDAMKNFALTDMSGKDPVGFIKGMITGARDMSLPDKFYEMWMNGLLSGIPTQVKNFVSNTVFNAYRTIVEKPTEVVLSKLNPYAEKRYFREVPKELFGMMKSIPEGLRIAKDMFLRDDLPQVSGKFTYGKAIKNKYLGYIVRTPSRLLEAVDGFFLKVIENGVLNSEAYKIARNEKLSGDALVSRISALIKNPTDNMLIKANSEKLTRTFRKPLGDFGNSIMKSRNKSPYQLGKYIAPFIKISANLGKEAIVRTPLGFLRSVPKEKLHEELAKPLLGSMLMTGLVLAKKGGTLDITGSLPKDKRDRDAFYNAGKQPYSIRIGDDWYSYGSVEPMASILGMSADIGESLDKNKESKADDLMKSFSYMFVKNFTEKTWMQSMREVIDLAYDPERNIGKFVKSYIPTFVPGSSMSRNIAKFQDPKLRKVEGVLNEAVNVIPYWKQSLPLRLNYFGDEITLADNLSQSIQNFASPFPLRHSSKDPIYNEILKVGAQINYPSQTIDMNTQDIKRFGIPEEFPLDPILYNEYIKESGVPIKKKVGHLIKSERYGNMNDTEKKEAIESIVRSERDRVRKMLKIKVRNKLIQETKGQ